MSATLPTDMMPRVAGLEQIARETQAVLERMEKRLDRMDERIDARLARMDDRIDALAREHHAGLRWLVGIMLGTFATLLTLGFGLLGVMAHGFHWL